MSKIAGSGTNRRLFMTRAVTALATGALGAPLAVGSALPVARGTEASPSAEMTNDEFLDCVKEVVRRADARPSAGMTSDVCEVDYPPAIYGRTLKEVEATIQEVVERVFRDEDGILRSGVNGRTMKPLRIEDVKDSPLALDRWTENSAIPRAAKPIWMNYENAGQASGKYLQALCAKARVTGDAHLSDLARRTVDAIVTLWNNAAATVEGLGGGRRGWFPKPYLGIRDVGQMWECSADQYADITLGLHSYYLSMASEQEKRTIEEIIISFADWWYDHDYSGEYFGKAIWWKRLHYNYYHPHSVGYFLYLNALAESWHPCRKFRHGFETWWKIKGGLYLTKGRGRPDLGGAGIALDCMERLIALRPDLADFWRPTASYLAQMIARIVEEGSSGPFFPASVNGFAAQYLATAHRLMPQGGYDRVLRHCLEACSHREDFYQIMRGLRVADLPKLVSGDDYRDVYWCENHVDWLNGYWNRPHTGDLPPLKKG